MAGFKNNYPSTVDYAIASNSLLDKIVNVMVFLQVSTLTTTRLPYKYIIVTKQLRPTIQIKVGMTWVNHSNGTRKHWKYSLTYLLPHRRLNKQTKLLNIVNGHINDAGHAITSIFLRAAEKSSLANKVTYIGKSKGRSKRITSKKWFDKDLKDQRMLVRRMARHKNISSRSIILRLQMLIITNTLEWYLVGKMHR